MPLARLQTVTCAAAIIAMAACSPIQYVSRPIDADASAAGYSARSAQSDGLRDFAVANGYAPGDWPPLQWGLKELTLTAWYFDADMRTARARATVALAKSDTGGASRNWSGTVKPEHHSRSPGDDSPWSLGLELEIPLVAQNRRAALAERNAFLVDAADIDVAMAAWLVRARACAMATMNCRPVAMCFRLLTHNLWRARTWFR